VQVLRERLRAAQRLPDHTAELRARGVLSPGGMTRNELERAWTVTSLVIIWTALLVGFIMTLVVLMMRH
jgi:hypothetical protein